MIHKSAQSLLLAIATILTVYSCTKSTPFGADLLEDQVADYDAVDVPVNLTVIKEDSVATSDRDGAFEYFLCGQLNDPVYGSSTSEIYSQFLVTSIPAFKPTDRLDSIVLILPYAVSGFYGDTAIGMQTIQVFQLDDTIAPSRNYYSNHSIAASNPVSDPYSFIPQPRTIKKILDTAASATKLAHLQVKLSNAFGQELMTYDSLTMANKFTFWRQSKGLKIVSTNNATPGCMMAFNLNSTNCFIRLFYTVGDTLQKTVNYSFNNSNPNKFMHFSHDYINTPAGASIGVLNPDQVYMQGISGLKLKVEFPTAAEDFDNILVNKADLELTTAAETDFSPIGQLAMYTKNTDTTFIVTSDVAYSLDIASGQFSLFGGTPQKKDGVYQYHLTMSKVFQDIVDAAPSDTAAKTVYINVFPQRGTAARTVFYGANHPTYPLKLRLKYTNL